MQSYNVGLAVLGPPMAPRHLCHHSKLLSAYAEGDLADAGDEREAYLSHFTFNTEMQRHYANKRNSVAGFAGPCCCRWLTFDIDRPDVAGALADARKLATGLLDRYPEAEPAVLFSGNKGFHLLLELTHNPPPTVGFHHTARTLAEALAALAGVTIDTAVYDAVHIIRLPNTRHPKTGLFKRRISLDELFALDVERIRRLAEHPSGEALPTSNGVPPQLPIDWTGAERRAKERNADRAAIRRDYADSGERRAPRYLIEFLRFGCDVGERSTTLFRSAAWLAEQGAPPSLVVALLTEPGRDVGLAPSDVERQIRCGIEHAARQRTAGAGPIPDFGGDYEMAERWCIQHESDPLPPGALDFPPEPMAGEKAKGGRREF